MEERFNFNVILNSFVFIIPINIVVLVFLAVYRFFFFVYFADFSAISSMKLYVLKAFWMGFRFDLSVVAYINAPVTLLFLICLLLKSYPFFKKIISFIKYYYFAIFTLILNTAQTLYIPLKINEFAKIFSSKDIKPFPLTKLVTLRDYLDKYKEGHKKISQFYGDLDKESY